MIERFNRRGQELDEIASSNQLSMDQFLKQHLYADLKDQNLQAQDQQAQDQQAQAPKPKTEHSKTKLPRDAGKIVRQIIF
jgi:hypothetical protein